MSRQNLPSNQQRHDNVAVIKLKGGKFKFEIACYRNKAQSYRKGVEKDVEEVLQIERVFTNVHDGKYAKISDVRAGLGPQIPKSKHMTDEQLERAACVLILKTGSMQLNEMEREAESEHMLNDIATAVTQKTIHPETRRPIPVTMVLSALKKIGFAPNNRKNTKAQALEAIRQLQASDVLAIERAPMYLRADLGTSVAADEFMAKLGELEGAALKVLKREPTVIDFLMNPSLYRDADTLAQSAGTHASLQVLAASVTIDKEGHVDFNALAPPGSSTGRSVERGTASMRSRSEKSDDDAPAASGKSKVDQRKARRADRKAKNKKGGAKDSDSEDVFDPLAKPGKGKGRSGAVPNDAEVSLKSTKGKNKQKGKASQAVEVSPSHAKAGSDDDSDDDDGAGRRGKKGKARRKKGGEDEAVREERLARRRKEKEEKEKEEFGEAEEVLNAAQMKKLEAKKREAAREDAALYADPNFYDSDNYLTEDYERFEASDNSLDIDEIRALRLEREAAQAEEQQKLADEAAEKNRLTTRKATQRKKKVKRNKAGDRVSDSESDGGDS